MKRRMFSVLICVLMALLLFTSCDNRTFVRSVDALLTPPLYYSEYEGLVTAFNNEVGKNVVLCNPTDGEYLSAITVSDLDDDGAEEALIFYRESSDSDNVNFSIFKNNNDVWKSCGEYTGYGNEVYSLTLDDMDGDGTREIMVVWYYQGISNANVFSLYRTEASTVKYSELTKEPCDVAGAVDMDDDGKSEILYVSTVNNGKVITRTANLLKFKGGEPVNVGSASLDPNVGRYINFKREKYNAHYPMKVYMDAIKNNNMMITEVVYWDSKQNVLLAPLYDEATGSNTATLRYEQIESADINNDGMIEIPVQVIALQEGAETGDVTYLTDWVYFVGSTPILDDVTYVNLSAGYYIALNSYNNMDFNVCKNTEGEDVWNVYAGEKSNVVFTVYTVPAESFNSEDYSSYISILKIGDSVICAQITDFGKQIGFKENDIRTAVNKLP